MSNRAVKRAQKHVPSETIHVKQLNCATTQSSSSQLDCQRMAKRPLARNAHVASVRVGVVGIEKEQLGMEKKAHSIRLLNCLKTVQRTAKRLAQRVLWNRLVVRQSKAMMLIPQMNRAKSNFRPRYLTLSKTQSRSLTASQVSVRAESVAAADRAVASGIAKEMVTPVIPIQPMAR